MFKLNIMENDSKGWETLCEYLAPEQAFIDYYTIVESILDEDMQFSYVALERDGIRVAFFSYDQYFGIKD